MDGIIKGNFAKNYDKNLFSKKELFKPNCFLNREVPKEKILVDLCCGSGVSIMYLKDRCKKIIGIDGSSDMIQICKNRFCYDKNVQLKIGLANNTGLPNCFCDIVLLRMGLHHIKNKKDVINESYRILKKGGKLLIMDRFLMYNKFFTFILDSIRNIKRGNFIVGHHYCKIEDLLNICTNFKHSYKTEVKQKFLIKSNLIFIKK